MSSSKSRSSSVAQDAEEAFARRDWSSALTFWNECISDHPKDPKLSQWRLSIGATLAEMGSYSAAEDAYRELVRDYPSMAGAMIGLARIAQLRRDWPEASKQWANVLEHFPTHPNTARWRNSFALALIELGRLTEAESIFSSMVSEHPTASIGYVGLAILSNARKDWVTAVERWNYCLSKFPSEPDGIWRSKRAIALERLEEWGEAYEAWDVIVRRGSTNVGNLLARARCNVRLRGPTAEAEDMVAAALALFPDDSRLLCLYASVATARGDDREALARYRQCIRTNPNDVSLYINAMHVATRCANAHALAELLTAAPADLSSTVQFRCSVLLGYHRLHANIQEGLRIIDRLSYEDDIDPVSARAIGQFLMFAVKNTKLIEFSQFAIKRFPKDPILIGIHLQATYLAHGADAFAVEKATLLSALTPTDAISVLRQLMPNLLSAEEVREVINDVLAGKDQHHEIMRSVLRIAYQSDSETLAYLFERVDCSGGSEGRALKLLLSAVIDKRRLEYANLGQVNWQDFRKYSESIVADFAGAAHVFDENSDQHLNTNVAAGVLKNILGRFKVKMLFSAECYYDAAMFAAWLAARIRAREPTSVIRLGDGEGAFLPYTAPLRVFQELDQRLIQQIWWGETRIEGTAAESMTTLLTASVLQADAVGIPPVRRLYEDLRDRQNGPNARGIVSVLRFIDNMDKEQLERKVLTSCHIHADLYSWDLYRQIFAPLKAVSVISCHDLARTLADRFGIAVRQWLRVPAEYKYAHLFDQLAESVSKPFYPELFDEIMEDVSPLPGEVILVAAGFLGKLLCTRIRERGGIAVDIGSAADLWIGHVTRRASTNEMAFDISSSLVSGQPFFDMFNRREFPESKRCRSDKTRRHNLIPRHAALFTTDVESADEPEYPLRIIGHPRCGSAYTTAVFNRLGFTIGHEKPLESGLCSWIHTVDDMNPAINAPYVPTSAFRTTLAYVRDPIAAIPSIMLENCRDDSFSFRRFHVARLLGIDIAARRSPLERAVEAYLCWMRIVDCQSPVLTLRVERLIEDLFANQDMLANAGLELQWSFRESAEAVRTDINSTTQKHRVLKPVVEMADYHALPVDLFQSLSNFCNRHGYPMPGLEPAQNI